MGEGISGGLQNSMQLAGASNDGVFIVQHIMQEAGLNDPDIREIAIIDGEGQVVAESNIPEDINKVVAEIRSKDYDFGVVFCKMDFPISRILSNDNPNEPPQEADKPRDNR